MSFFRIFILVCLLISPGIIFADAACPIASGPTPRFADYIKTVQSQVSQIRAFAAKNTQCKGNTPGSFASEKRFFETIDRVDANTPSFPSLVQDFSYSISLAVKGNDRKVVTAHGNLIKNLEVSVILPALQSAASTCSLDSPMLLDGISGNTPESALTILLQTNKKLETYYKEVALGFPNHSETDEKMKLLFDEIRDTYSPHATIACESPSGWDELSTKFMLSIEKTSKKSNTAQDEWKNAIALFRGENTKTMNYYENQKRLLAAELARQWVTKNARDVMLGSLSCLQRKTVANASPSESSVAFDDCRSIVALGFWELIAGFSKSYINATNMDQYLANLVSTKTEAKTLQNDMSEMYTQINSLIVDEESKSEDEALTNIINIHASLVTTNALIKTKAESMRKNCMKAQPDIDCPK